MASAFRDTLFAYTLRSVFGSRVLPTIWQDKLSSQTSPRDSAQSTLHGVPRHDGKDTLLVDWYGPTDPDNPLNWSSGKKAWVMFQTCLLTFTIYVGSAIYTAGIPSISAEFHVSTVAATVGLTVFVAGYGLVPQIGRMPIYIFTLAVFALLQIPTALATNYGMLMAFRFLTGFFGSPILATGARPLGPLLGSFSAYFEGWRWTMWELLWLSSASFVLLFFFFPETSAGTILYRRAQIAVAAMSPRDLAVDVLVRPFALNFQEPIVFALNAYIGLIYALLYIWFESFPVQLLGCPSSVFHWRIPVMPPFFAYLYYVQEPKYNENGELKPEERMPVAIVGALLVPFLFLVHWIVPIIGSSLFSIAALLLFNAVLNYLADAYPTTPRGSAGNDFIRSMFGAAFPLFARAITLLGLLACAFVPIPILLYNKRARHDF
ncbi:major facilitator superfamily domain-containing protein [Russula vinacea]|nr:major facilitator superfamily domain-containing protein [Russula vinacea]